MRGMGIPLASVSSLTMAYSRGYSCSVTGLDRDVAMAILSENQYMEKLNSSAKISATVMPPVPHRLPIATKSPPRAAISTQVLTLFTFHPSSLNPRPVRGSLPLYDGYLRMG